ncbi:hypothetical protein CAEBREN_10322 [Caenorhabditis brenneri]|uniref:Uncharacterized protein n=1 Tax=Caenorhabditis brenneri TaxID=135651 RepID=G0PAZ0_CAEBE|nr:hypothetical protein CAEBREN_10322 [Caenorhabditis brenneri]
MFMARNTPGEPPKCKYSIVTLQTCNAVFAIIMLSLSGKPNRLEENPSFNWTALISLIAILLIFVAIKLIIWYKDHANQEASNPKNRCKRDLLIGYGAISICGYIPLIVMYVIGYHPIFVTSAIICYTAPGFIFLLFILQHLKKYQVCREDQSISYHVLSSVLHVIVFVVIAFFVGRLKTEFGQWLIMWDTLLFALVRGEFLAVLVNGVWLKERIERPNVAGLPEPMRRSSCHLESCSSDSLDSFSVKFVRTEINHGQGWQTGAATEEFCNIGYCDGAKKSAANC